jgi:hypothetical protein
MNTLMQILNDVDPNGDLPDTKKALDYAKEVLGRYTAFLVKEGYCDSDVYCEPPTTIDRFIYPKLNK